MTVRPTPPITRMLVCVHASRADDRVPVCSFALASEPVIFDYSTPGDRARARPAPIGKQSFMRT
jgi:hypothetical protein